MQYDHKHIEQKWQKKWLESGAFNASEKSDKKKFYPLIEFPYPSGAGLHVGHPRPYIALDIVARKRRAEGYNVLYPIGWDAFGLPTENYAIKTGRHPRDITKENTDNFRRQIQSLGISFDWSREVNTTDPTYYRWTQWIFLQLYKHGLAYKAKTEINWCPKCKIGLANEEVVDGTCERCGTPVEKREKEQWMLRITKYAQRLYDDLDTVDYIERAKTQQRNWIGPSEGAEIVFPIAHTRPTNYVFIHGHNSGASQRSFWAWLKKYLEERGHTVWLEELPNGDAPTPMEQVQFVLDTAPFDDNTVVIGHSLGSVVGLKVAEEMKLKKLVLVGGFIAPDYTNNKRYEYEKKFDWKFDFDAIRKNVAAFSILADTEDKSVSNAQTQALADALREPMLLVTASEPHFKGAVEPSVLNATVDGIMVFTTRPDTLFGATYMVLAPEHPLVATFELENRKEVEKYVAATRKKTEIERTAEGREKTGVELKGVKAINPATKEEIPIYIADYVLAGYGTGAIMAVPAHDERDYAFAKAVNQRNEPTEIPEGITHAGAFLESASRPGTFLFQKRDMNARTAPGKISLFGGALEEDEDVYSALRRELKEELEFEFDDSQILKTSSMVHPDDPTRVWAAHIADVQEDALVLHEGEAILPLTLREALAHPLLNEHMRRVITAFMETTTIPIRQVIEPVVTQSKDPGIPKPDQEFTRRESIIAVVKHWSRDAYLVLKWKKVAWHTFITGGIEEGQTPEEAAVMEIRQETGFLRPSLKKYLGVVHGRFYHAPKGRNMQVRSHILYFELEDGSEEQVSDEEKGNHEVLWVEKEKLQSLLTPDSHHYTFDILFGDARPYPGEGVLVHSGQFDGFGTAEAKKVIVDAVGGRMVTTYKLRDWVFSRQRYWGEPIPMIHCEKDGWVPVPEDQLPVLLPEVEKYEPTDTGESPLANIAEFVNTTCPKCGGAAKRETDVMPNWAGSSWYYLRYTDPENKKDFAGSEALKYWTPVDWYNGGMEHTVLHLLYSRFWHKFLYDIGVVPTAEPYKKRTSHGLILAEGGEKMSKSKGNVVNPDDIVERFGADAMRCYEMFMGPFDQTIAWSTDGLVGTRRFLERVIALSDRVADVPVASVEQRMHQTIKKVSDDIEHLKMNTAISALMIFANALHDEKEVSKEAYEMLLRLLAPFAPHLAEELWARIGHKEELRTEAWPQFDEKKMKGTEVTIAIQINGKLRGSIIAPIGIGEKEALNKAMKLPNVAKLLDKKTPKRLIYIPERLLNIVV